MKTAIKSDNKLHACINHHFVVKVREPGDKDWKLTTARKLNDYVENKELTEKLFDKALNGGKYKYVFKIRERLKIKFNSK